MFLEHKQLIFPDTMNCRLLLLAMSAVIATAFLGDFYAEFLPFINHVKLQAVPFFYKGRELMATCSSARF